MIGKRDKHGMIIPYKPAASFEYQYFAPGSFVSKHQDHGLDTALKAKREALRVLRLYKCGSVHVVARFSDSESEQLGVWSARPTACVVKRD